MSYLLRDRHMCVDMYWRQSSADCSGWRGCMAVGLRWVGSGIGAWVALHGGRLGPFDAMAWARWFGLG
eukprot:8627535-Alexandrium_andersonii.AAC.1